MTSPINLYNHRSERLTKMGTKYVCQMLAKNSRPTDDEKNDMAKWIGCDLTVLTVNTKKKISLIVFIFF